MGGDFSSVEIKNLQAENKRLRAQFKDLDVSPNVLLLAILVPLYVYSSARKSGSSLVILLKVNEQSFKSI